MRFVYKTQVIHGSMDGGSLLRRKHIKNPCILDSRWPMVTVHDPFSLYLDREQACSLSQQRLQYKWKIYLPLLVSFDSDLVLGCESTKFQSTWRNRRFLKQFYTVIICVMLVILSSGFETETLLKMKLVVLLRLFTLAF